MSSGKHHISVCDLNKIETDHNEKETKTGTAYVSFSTDSFLQTARDEVSNLNNNDFLTSRLLFISGSKQTYITDKLRRLLDLQSARAENTRLTHVVRLTEVIMKEIDFAQLKVRHHVRNIFVFSEASCYSFHHLKSKKLALTLM